MKLKQTKGFTLLEVLLVVAAIGILAAIVIVAINPQRQLGKVRDAERQSEVGTIKKSIEQYSIANEGTYPSEIETMNPGVYQEICDTEAVDPSNCPSDYVDISDVVPEQLADIPRDPQADRSDAETGYEVLKDANGNISVRAPQTEVSNTKYGGVQYEAIPFINAIGGGSSDGFGVIQETSDGGYIAAGRTFSYGAGFNDGYVVKLNSDGSEDWSKTFGGSSDERFIALRETSDGGYIAAGYTESYGAGFRAGYVVKLKSDGSEDWSKTFGGSSSDEFRSIQETSDGGYIGVGKTASYGAGNDDGYVVKLNSDGSEDWSKTFGGSSNDQFRALQETSDGGYIAVGETDSYGAGSDDGYVVKLKSDGSEDWSKTFGGSSSDEFRSIQETSDGGYIAAGRTFSYGAGGNDGYVVKLNSDGSEDWSRTFGGSDFDGFNALQETSDGSYITVGETNSYGAGNDDGYVVKLNSDGSEDWSKTFGGSDFDYFESIRETSDEGYIAAGDTRSYGAGSADGYVVKLKSDGSEDWSKTLGGGDYDTFQSIRKTSDGGYIAAGYTESYGAGSDDGYVVKLKSDGSEDWSKTFGGSDDDRFKSIQETSDGGYIAVGYTESYGAGSSDGYVVKLKSDGSEDWSKTFGGSDDDIFKSIQETSDEGYIAAGDTRSYGAGSADGYVSEIGGGGKGLSDCTACQDQTGKTEVSDETPTDTTDDSKDYSGSPAATEVRDDDDFTTEINSPDSEEELVCRN